PFRRPLPSRQSARMVTIPARRPIAASVGVSVRTCGRLCRLDPGVGGKNRFAALVPVLTDADSLKPNRCPEDIPEVIPEATLRRRLPVALQEAMAENEKLRAENKQLLDWITGESDALTTLQSIYQSPASSEHTRIKAATGALPFERPKLTATGVVVMDFRERVRQARLKADAKLIEHIPESAPEPAA